MLIQTKATVRGRYPRHACFIHGRKGMEPMAQLVVSWFVYDGAIRVHAINRVSHVATKLMTKATTRQWLDVALTHLFGHRIESDYLVGPVGIMTTRRGRSKLHENLTAIVQLVDLANLHDVPKIQSLFGEARRDIGAAQSRHRAPV